MGDSAPPYNPCLLATYESGWYHNHIKHVFKFLFGRSAAIKTGEWSVEYMWVELAEVAKLKAELEALKKKVTP